ncbi:MAG: hypothetical protein J5494_09525, partial [Candidatus Methanomethylophilaceae archaeon]|nr:hypothetical protein [Candidatus Methanomethylophilaceae archaeon]
IGGLMILASPLIPPLYKDEGSVRELVRIYALCERGILYDWCLSGGEYSLAETGSSTMAILMRGLIPQQPEA